MRYAPELSGNLSDTHGLLARARCAAADRALLAVAWAEGLSCRKQLGGSPCPLARSRIEGRCVVTEDRWRQKGLETAINRRMVGMPVGSD